MGQNEKISHSKRKRGNDKGSFENIPHDDSEFNEKDVLLTQIYRDVAKIYMKWWGRQLIQKMNDIHIKINL